MRTRIDVRLGAQAQAGHGREHDRCEQHDGGIEAEDGGDQARDREHEGQERYRAAA